jgi:NAD(P)-dependent dehydrogenase (short-subunit alcohol dehydrogenase family)
VPIALVTGANRGIGRETARQLAERDYDVIVSARDESKAREPAEAVGGRPLRLDVSDPASIEQAAAALREDPGALDVLVNNAGVGTDWGVAGAEPDFEAIQSALDTNFFGAYRLTVALLPLLRESDHPRVVNVSSGMGGIAEMGGWSPGYRVSKAALNAMTRILSAELENAGGDGEGSQAPPARRFKVNSACPGFVNTDMGGQFGAKKPVEDGAAGIVWLATLPDDGPTGGFFRDGKPVAF